MKKLIAVFLIFCSSAQASVTFLDLSLGMKMNEVKIILSKTLPKSCIEIEGNTIELNDVRILDYRFGQGSLVFKDSVLCFAGFRNFEKVATFLTLFDNVHAKYGNFLDSSKKMKYPFYFWDFGDTTIITTLTTLESNKEYSITTLIFQWKNTVG